MNYNSTRNKNAVVTASQAIAQGISEEGGLFVPQELPKYTLDDIKALAETDYRGRAKKIMGDFLSDFTAEEIAESVEAAYTAEKFGSDNPAPISYIECGDKKISLLELWHGPTSAFKDMALQILPHLLTKSVKKTYDGKEAVILVATSGDTGKAALEGFRDVDGTKIIVFYPVDGVSPMQKRQMATQKGENVNVVAIKGNFDDAQTGVKKIFTNAEIKNKLAENNMLFSSANSINWGRLLPQIVYYFSAYSDMVNEGKIKLGDKINVAVPTGNFGNILASFYAMNMGLPINKFICASNSNNVLTDFIRTGTYDKKRQFYTTISPSMDILVSSNLERLLYHLTDGNAEKVAELMKALSENGVYTVDDDIKAKLDKYFWGGFCDDENTKKTIGSLYEKENYLADTHTAVAVNVYNQYVEETGDKTPTVIASTASPYKFAKSVLTSITDEALPEDEFAMVDELSAKTKTKVPAPLAALKDAKERFDFACEVDEMPQTVLSGLSIN
ncbi:MAG: threonine synthase [Clostridia bacterium]|nr:threonine synthase [Clostridia bacterium]